MRIKPVQYCMVLFFLVSVLSLAAPAVAQEATRAALPQPSPSPTVEQTYQLYSTLYNDYRDTYAQFLKAKNSHLTYGTLTSLTEYLEASKALLKARDEVLITYVDLLFLRNIDPNYREILFEQKTKLLTHKESIAAIATLRDAQRVSDKALENHYFVLQNVSRQIVGTILLQKVEGEHDRLEQLEQEMHALTQTIKNQKVDVSTLERWLLEAQNKRQLAQSNIRTLHSFIAGLAPGTNYNKFQLLLYSANQYLKEAGDFYHEFLEEVKYGNY